MAATSAPTPEALWSALEALPPTVKGEIIKGALYTQPRPLAAHQNVAGLLGADLVNHYQRGRGGPGGWLILIEPGIRLTPKEEFSPDVAGWRKERLPSVPTGPITLVPDWLCEVQSRGTRRYDLETKRAFYAEIGVPWLWYIDPEARTLLVSRLERGRWVEQGMWSGSQKVAAPPFEAAEVDLGEWWGEPADE